MTRPDTIPRLTGKTIQYGRSGNAPEHDSLMLVTGKTVGETPDNELRVILDRFGVPNSFIDGRAIIVAKYADLNWPHLP
jgi:hypothetical protein